MMIGATRAAAIVAAALLISACGGGGGGGSTPQAQPNQPPTADAGTDQTVFRNAAVTLSGAQSRDPNNDSLAYRWTQTGGPSVALEGALTAAPTFRAPQLTGAL